MPVHFHVNLKEETIRNDAYRDVIYTDDKMQIVIMSIPVGGKVDKEKHDNTSQLIRVEAGVALVIVNETTYLLETDDVIVVPPRYWHTIINQGKEPLKFSTTYAGEILHPYNEYELTKPIEF